MRLMEFKTRKYPPQAPVTVDLDEILTVTREDTELTRILFKTGQAQTVVETYDRVISHWRTAK